MCSLFRQQAKYSLKTLNWIWPESAKLQNQDLPEFPGFDHTFNTPLIIRGKRSADLSFFTKQTLLHSHRVKTSRFVFTPHTLFQENYWEGKLTRNSRTSQICAINHSPSVFVSYSVCILMENPFVVNTGNHLPSWIVKLIRGKREACIIPRLIPNEQ